MIGRFSAKTVLQRFLSNSSPLVVWRVSSVVVVVDVVVVVVANIVVVVANIVVVVDVVNIVDHNNVTDRVWNVDLKTTTAQKFREIVKPA